MHSFYFGRAMTPNKDLPKNRINHLLMRQRTSRAEGSHRVNLGSCKLVSALGLIDGRCPFLIFLMHAVPDRFP